MTTRVGADHGDWDRREYITRRRESSQATRCACAKKRVIRSDGVNFIVRI